MRILHLSDLHFKQSNTAQDIVLSSLTKKIDELAKSGLTVDSLLITGDIAFSGRDSEYKEAKTFIDKIVASCKINSQNILFIPGNHDVDRSKIKPQHLRWYYNFENEDQLRDSLTSEDSFPKLIEKKTAYFEFIKSYSANGITTGKHGEYVSHLTDPNSGTFKVMVVGLNSALFCGYNGDDQKKLALGLEQVQYCDTLINSSEEIVITCLHHPFECFHPCDKPSLNFLSRFSDIVLSGHVHEADNCAKQGGNSGQTVFITAGSSYETREKQNGFNIIEIDTNSLKGHVVFYKYIPKDHMWIQDKEINHENNGLFHFTINKGNGIKVSTDTVIKSTSTALTSGPLKKQYMAVLDIKYDDLNRDNVEIIIEHLKKITGDNNTTITRMEKGSVKVYFETSTEVSKEKLEEFKKSKALPIVEINKLKEHETVSINDKSVFHWRTFMNPDFTKNLENPGAAFIHSRVDELKLKDLYVSPYFKRVSVSDGSDKTEKIVNSDEPLKKKSGESLRIVVYGAENSGKSTLARWWYEKYYDGGYIPILVPGSRIKYINSDKLIKMAQEEFNQQYMGVMGGEIESFDPDRIIIIIDDFHRVRFTKPKFKVNLIANLSRSFKNLVILGNDLMQYETYTLRAGFVKNILEEFDRYHIIEFGPKLRYELIKKWNGLGSDLLDKNELIRINNETEKHVESILGKNFVPSYPVYLLTILQAREASIGQKPEYSLHGFYYELLINDALNKAVENKSEISLYYNFITEYCYFLFDSKIRLEPLHRNDFSGFFKHYCEEYKIKKDIASVTNVLIESKLLRIDKNYVSIPYKYVYYFFVAKYLANNISEQRIRDIITLLCERIHRDEFASIIMYLTHLSKDQFVLNQLLNNSKSLFSSYPAIRMDDDISFINEMVKQLPQQVYQPIDVEQLKEEELKEEEALSHQEREFDEAAHIYNYDLNEDISALDVLAMLTKSMKTIEILGQVTKKYWGELKAPQKYDLAEETYMLGLRTLGFYYTLIKSDPDDVIDYLKHIYRRKHKFHTVSKEEIDKASRNYLFNVCAMSSFAIIKRVTNAIGYENLAGTFDDILKNHDFNSVKLIDVAIKLDHHKNFPIIEVRNVKKTTDKNFLSSVVLKNLVINYLYVFHTTVEDKQKICALLDIKMEQQRMIDATSVVKRESPRLKG